MPTDRSAVDRAARERMGLALTSVQREAVEASVQGRDTLVVSPTGSGKSAIYQLSGAMLPGTSVVVSPLVALQHDQLDALRHRDVGAAVVVNSVRGRAARRDALARIRRGGVEFVLLGPEQLVMPEVLDALREIDIDRLVVDEAHCVDAWGPDFRPDFLALGAVRAALGGPVVLALTATAAPHVREQIIATLAMREPAVIACSPERPNIHVGVRTHPDRNTAREAGQGEVPRSRTAGSSPGPPSPRRGRLSSVPKARNTTKANARRTTSRGCRTLRPPGRCRRARLRATSAGPPTTQSRQPPSPAPPGTRATAGHRRITRDFLAARIDIAIETGDQKAISTAGRRRRGQRHMARHLSPDRANELVEIPSGSARRPRPGEMRIRSDRLTE